MAGRARAQKGPGAKGQLPSPMKKAKNDPVNQSSQHQPAPVVAAQAISQRKCLVCTRPTGSYDRRYCPEHTGGYWKWLECSEPGCEVVGERTIPGQTLYRCPAHKGTASQPSPARQEPGEDSPGRAAVRRILAERRNSLNREREHRRNLPPRPPFNIGHYI